MGRRIGLGLAWVSVAAAGIGFLLPWASIELHEPEVLRQLRQLAPAQETVSGLTKDVGRIVARIKRGTEVVTGELPSLSDIPQQVSGAQIPRMVNQRNAQVAIALVELLTTTRHRLGLKSYVVYVVPGLALLCGVLLTLLGARRAIAAGVAGLCLVVAAIGGWKLLTAPTASLLVSITIERGLWLSLWAYVGLALAAVLHLLPLRLWASRGRIDTPSA